MGFLSRKGNQPIGHLSGALYSLRCLLFSLSSFLICQAMAVISARLARLSFLLLLELKLFGFAELYQQAERTRNAAGRKAAAGNFLRQSTCTTWTKRLSRLRTSR